MSISWEQALRIETATAKIIHKQEEAGVQFDREKADKVIEDLNEYMDRCYDEIRPMLDMDVNQPYKAPVNAPFLKSGKYSANAIKWMGDAVDQVVGPFSRVEFLEPDLGSRPKLTKQLLQHGWKPTIFTEPTTLHPSGTPKLTIKGQPVDSLTAMTGGVGKKIAEWYVASHRRGQVKGFYKLIREDGRISARANSCGTNTARMRHAGVVNIPKADPSVFFGARLRELFTVRPGNVMVGYDASGLEARMEAHYTHPFDDGVYAKEIMEGDIHTKNMEVFGCSRPIAKGCKYALTYGAQKKKLAETLGCPMKRAGVLFDAFWKENASLGKLRERVMTASERGWIPGIDGRKIYIRSSHSALNALFQSAGAIVMKLSMIFMDAAIKKEGLQSLKVLDQHDEGQHELPEEDVVQVVMDTEEAALEYKVKMEEETGKLWSGVRPTEDGRWRLGYSRVGELGVLSIRRAGEHLKMRIPLDGEYLIGMNWSQTH